MNPERLTTPWWALRAGLGATAFLAGLDKFFNLLADWPAYLSPIAAQLVPPPPRSRDATGRSLREQARRM